MDIYVNDNFAFTINKNIFTLANLQPDTTYKIFVKGRSTKIESENRSYDI